MEDITGEAASRLVEDVLSMIRAFCTPLGSVMGSVLLDAMKIKCISAVVDGGVLKVARLLQQKYMPNMIIVCRDASHAIRIACKAPLVRTGVSRHSMRNCSRRKVPC